jgi:hypothetical protein
MGVFQKTTTNLPPSVSTEELRSSMPQRTASSFESIASTKTRPTAAAMEPEQHPELASLPERPQVLTRMPSVQTRYVSMLLHLDDIPRLYNILAAGFTWILLAGFLVIPGTFTTFKDHTDDSKISNTVENAIVNSISHIGLVWVSGAFCIIGAVGCCWLWFLWRKNYVWLINRIFL